MKIIVDYRERSSGIPAELQNQEGISFQIGKIAYGDYIIDDTITIERKTARDFLVSLINGRLFRQVSNLKRYCHVPLLLIEGNPYHTDLDVDARAIKGAVISIQSIWYVPVIHSHSLQDTIEIIMTIGRQDESSRDVVPLRGGYRPKRLKSQQLYLLQGLPLVGPVLAKRLVTHFGSVSKMLNATVTDLTGVDGIGIKSAKKIRAVLDWEG